MKKIFLIILIFYFFQGIVSAAIEAEDEYVYASEIVNESGSEIVIPEDINWTQRFILTELKELRIQLESTRRELNEELNARELASVDRALSYNANTVNFLWIIITIVVTGFGLVGWRTMKDVRDNLTNNFEKEVQKRIKEEQKKLESFMRRFEKDQLEQSRDILKNQEFIQKKQEASYYWSQYNREEDSVQKLDLLDKISGFDFEENILPILVEKSSIYTALGLWDKALESSEKGLEISSENTSLLYTKAEALVMLEKNEAALKVINNILVIKPGLREDILEDITFEELRTDIEAMMDEVI